MEIFSRFIFLFFDIFIKKVIIKGLFFDIIWKFNLERFK